MGIFMRFPFAPNILCLDHHAHQARKFSKLKKFQDYISWVCGVLYCVYSDLAGYPDSGFMG
jgi:hypothetical protein